MTGAYSPLRRWLRQKRAAEHAAADYDGQRAQHEAPVDTAKAMRDFLQAELDDFDRRMRAVAAIGDPRVPRGFAFPVTGPLAELARLARDLTNTLMRTSGKRATAIVLGRREWAHFDCVKGMSVDGLELRLDEGAESLIGVEGGERMKINVHITTRFSAHEDANTIIPGLDPIESER